jgi:hypothetical protein
VRGQEKGYQLKVSRHPRWRIKVEQRLSREIELGAQKAAQVFYREAV